MSAGWAGGIEDPSSLLELSESDPKPNDPSDTLLNAYTCGNLREARVKEVGKGKGRGWRCIYTLLAN